MTFLTLWFKLTLMAYVAIHLGTYLGETLRVLADRGEDIP